MITCFPISEVVSTTSARLSRTRIFAYSMAKRRQAAVACDSCTARDIGNKSLMIPSATDPDPTLDITSPMHARETLLVPSGDFKPCIRRLGVIVLRASIVMLRMLPTRNPDLPSYRISSTFPVRLPGSPPSHLTCWGHGTAPHESVKSISGHTHVGPHTLSILVSIECATPGMRAAYSQGSNWMTSQTYCGGWHMPSVDWSQPQKQSMPTPPSGYAAYPLTGMGGRSSSSAIGKTIG